VSASEAPCPLCVSRPGADRAERVARVAGVSVEYELQVPALPRSLGLDNRILPDIQGAQAPGVGGAAGGQVPGVSVEVRWRRLSFNDTKEK
jgi:hypothetical protein